jgi:CheY-like chemotaxis protein
LISGRAHSFIAPDPVAWYEWQFPVAADANVGWRTDGADAVCERHPPAPSSVGDDQTSMSHIETVTDLLVRPVSALRKLSDNHRIEAVAHGVRPDAPRVLLVEDRQTYQASAVVLLAGWGIKPRIACNCAEALPFAVKDCVDIILMSVEMPSTDGFDAAAQIRRIEGQNCGHKRIPIVACTVSDQESNGPQVKASGMDDVLIKPYGVDAMAACLRRWLPGKFSQIHE